MRTKIPNHHRRNEEGVAIIMVIVFLVVMAGLISLNNQILSQFKREIEINELRQEQKWGTDLDNVAGNETATPASTIAESEEDDE